MACGGREYSVTEMIPVLFKHWAVLHQGDRHRLNFGQKQCKLWVRPLWQSDTAASSYRSVRVSDVSVPGWGKVLVMVMEKTPVLTYRSFTTVQNTYKAGE